jgi:predicted GNAT family acetyltransferase
VSGVDDSKPRAEDLMTEGEVVDNERESRYELQTEGGLALLDYMREDGRIALVHTEVPRRVEGRGFAARLVTAALADAKARGLQVLPMCAYVKAFIAKHREYEPLVWRR